MKRGFKKIEEARRLAVKIAAQQRAEAARPETLAPERTGDGWIVVKARVIKGDPQGGVRWRYTVPGTEIAEEGFNRATVRGMVFHRLAVAGFGGQVVQTFDGADDCYPTISTVPALAPERTAEGWIILHAEYRNDDPFTFDDCWHRGPYWRFTVPGTPICEEGSAIFADPTTTCWTVARDKVFRQLADAGFVGQVVETYHVGKTTPPPYRVVETISETYRSDYVPPPVEDGGDHDGADRGL